MNLLYNKSLFLSAYNGCNIREHYDRGNFVLNLGCCFNPHLLVSTFLVERRGEDWFMGVDGGYCYFS